MLSQCNFRRNYVIWIGFIVLFARMAYGQITNVTDDQSAPTPGVGHDYVKMLTETVNPANGSVSLRIQVPMPPGRKLAIPFAFTYDSNGVNHPASGAPAIVTWASNLGYLSQGGWGYSVPMISLEQFTAYWYRSDGFTVPCIYFTDYMFFDPSGGRHALGLGVVSNPSSQACQSAWLTPKDSAPPWSVLQAGDDFFRASAPPSTGVPVTVADADGTAYDFPNPFAHPITSSPASFGLPSFIEDRNGNQITITDSGGGAFTYKDTLGRTAISSSGFGATGNTVRVSGLSNPYTVSWGTASSGFSAGSSTATDRYCPSTIPNESNKQEPVVRSITLPNGESYQFLYDSDNPSVYDVAGNGPYGLVSKITYPTGGYVEYIWTLNSQSEFAAFTDSFGNPEACTYTYGTPAVSKRIVSFDGQTQALEQDFSYSTLGWSAGVWTTKTATVTTHDLLRGTSFTTRYTYSPVTVAQPPDDLSLFAAQVPVEQTVEYDYDNVVGHKLRVVNKAWVDQYEMQGQQVVDYWNSGGSS
jgi:hypothetical protein